MGQLKPREGRRCAQPKCGFVLGPQNRSGYCAKHSKPSDRAERRFCTEPGCGERLRSDNTTEFCFAHRCQKLRSVAKTCGECGKKLNAQNLSGYCSNHHHLRRPSHARAIAKAAARPVCKEAGCQRAANRNGYCAAHKYAKNRPSVKPQFCKAPSCRAPLKSNNRSGYCRKHSYLVRLVEPRKCKEPRCQEVLGNNNASGYCAVHRVRHLPQEHREAAKLRTAEWRAREKRRAWRPEKWEAAPPDKKAIALILIERPGISNVLLGEELDRARLIKCEYGQSWQRALGDSKDRFYIAANTYISKIRKWAGQPGKDLRHPGGAPKCLNDQRSASSCLPRD